MNKQPSKPAAIAATSPDSSVPCSDSQLSTLNSQLPKEFITKDEVARRLRKTPRTIEKWQSTGVIPFIKIGTTVLYNWPDLGDHLQQHFRVIAPKPPPLIAGAAKAIPHEGE